MTIILAIVFLSIILLLHEGGHFLAAKFSKTKVEEFGFGYPPKIWGKKVGQTEISLNALPFGGFNKIDQKDFDRQSAGRRSIILSSGILMNILLGWLFFVLIFTVGSQPLVIIGGTADNSPAALAGLRANDIVISVSSFEEILTAPFSSQKFIEFIKRFSGEVVTVKINRLGKILEFNVLDRENPPAGEGALGVSLIEAGQAPQSFGKSLFIGLKAVGLVAWSTVAGIYQLVTQAFFKPNLINNLIGPVGAVALAGQVGKIGFVYLLQLMAVLSVGFAVFNFLPFPALDGGHLLLILIEKIKGSSVPDKFKNLINAFGLGFLIILMIFVTIKDIKGLL